LPGAFIGINRNIIKGLLKESWILGEKVILNNFFLRGNLCLASGSNIIILSIEKIIGKMFFFRRGRILVFLLRGKFGFRRTLELIGIFLFCCQWRSQLIV
jgi:hypothetical protein